MAYREYRELYDLKYVQALLPGIWATVEPKLILKQDITTIQKLKDLNDDIQFYEITDKDNQDQIKSLSPDQRALLTKLQGIFDRCKNKIQNLNYTNYSHNQVTPSQQYVDPQFYQQYYQSQLYQNQMYGYPQQQQQIFAQQQNGYQYQQQSDYSNNYQQNYQQNYSYQQQYPQNYSQNYQQPNYSYQQNYGQQNHFGHSDYQANKPHRRHYNNQHHNQQYYNNYNHPQQQAYVQQKNNSFQDYNQYQIATTQQVKVQTPVEQKPQPQPVIIKPVVVEPPKIEKKKLSIQQIRKLFNNVVDQEELKKNVTKQLVKQVQQVNNWKKTVQTVKVQQQQDKNKGKQPYQKGGRNEGNKQDNRQFNKGSKYGKPQPPPNLAPTFDIQIGKNENLQTRKVKNQLRSKAADKDFAEEKAKQQQNLGKIQKVKRQIIYNLNIVAPENVKQIFQQMQKYATQQLEICVVLVVSIIQKAWDQPKYAASYAKLSSYFAKIDPKKFNFNHGDDKKEKKNPFKFILIEKVQHSFDKKEKKEIQKKQEDKQKLAKDLKTHLMGNVKFIAELIKIKLITKRTIRYCISQLLSNFIEGYYQFHKNKATQQNFYEFNFQSLIQFLQNLGEKFQQIDEKSKQKGEEQPTVNLTITYQKVAQQLREYFQLKKPYAEIDGLDNLKADDYFNLFKIINETALPKVRDGRRIGALLQNLDQRRFNNWKKHNVESEGPKKLKDLLKQQQNLTAQQKQKNELIILDQKMVKIFKKWIQNQSKAALQELDVLAKKFSIGDLVGTYLKYVSDDKKDVLPKRMQIWGVIVDKYLNKSLKQSWKTAFNYISLLGAQFPYLPAVVSKLLIEYKQKKGGKYIDFYIKFNQDSEEDQFYSMDDLLQRLYHYTKDEQIKSHINVKQKLSHLL